MERRIRSSYLIIADILLMCASLAIAFLLRFDRAVPLEFVHIMERYIFSIILLKLIILYIFKLYGNLWMYASIEEMIKIVAGIAAANIAVVLYLFFIQSPIPRSVYIISTMLDTIFIGGLRFSFRIIKTLKSHTNILNKNTRKKIMIIGAGEAGAMVINELKTHESLNSEAVTIIDDDHLKKGMMIKGVPVEGSTKDILEIVAKRNIDEIIISMPSASKKEIADIVNICTKTNCKLKTLPGVYELLDGKVNISKIRQVDIEDLLGREEVILDTENIRLFLQNKTVMITGGAGSIGSEIARQVLKYDIHKLILFDVNENGLYNLQQELQRKYERLGEDLNLEVVIASIRDIDRLEYIFNKYKPEVVFHTAAHKHVPLMEKSLQEALKNNVFGTLNLVKTSEKYGVEKFVQISTDKAVNPTNVMGATKRICEMIVQTYGQNSKTEFTAVRFGNVLGSSGSVIPLFKKQIEEGGPVTVTHPDIIRYFMTIPEAAQLVMQAGAMAKGGEIFILDMGEPVKILELAEDLIRLSGYIPYEDIDIKITGLRPGEKLYEELLLSEEGLRTTGHKKIFIGKPILIDINYLNNHLESLKLITSAGNDTEIRKELKNLVPSYNYKEVTNENKIINFAKRKN